jgi:cytochrome c oxidase subunit IV
MAGHGIGTRMYVGIGAALIALTVVTLLVSFAELPAAGHLTAGLAIGGLKAALVALFFMHLLRSGKVTWIVITVTLFWVGILFVLTLTDYLTRDSVPHMPGH